MKYNPKEYYLRNKERIKETRKEWYKKVRDKLLEKKKVEYHSRKVKSKEKSNPVCICGHLFRAHYKSKANYIYCNSYSCNCTKYVRKK